MSLPILPCRLQQRRRAFGPVLSKTTGAVAARTPAASSGVQAGDLDVMASQLTHVSSAGPGDRGTPKTYVVSSKTVPIRLSFACLALLSSSNVQTVRRIFRARDLECQPPPKNFSWSCYWREREIDNATAVLTHAIREHEIFTRGNTFHLGSSPYLDPTVSIVFEYVSSHDDPRGPELHESHLRDPHRALEKTSVLVAGRQQAARLATCGDQQLALRSHPESVTVG